MKKTIYLAVLGITLAVPNVNALTEVVEGSWATYNEGVIADASLVEKGNENRTILENSLYTADATEENGRNEGFTGIGYFGEEGVTYYFDQFDENGNKTYNSLLVGNPDETKPDLTLTEVTWDGDKSTWIGEGAEVWAVNYNGTGEDRLVAYAYNKTALIRAEANGAELLQVEGAKIEHQFQSEAHNLYETLVYFPEDFVYCSAIRIVDITNTLKQYGGTGQNSNDGYDLDALYGYKILYIPATEDITYQKETAVSVGELNLGCENSWQKVVMKVNTSDLKDGQTVQFDIIAGQHYKIGVGEVYLDENGEAKVRYNFTTSYNLVKVNDVKIGIYKNYNNMLKGGKLLGNGKLVKDEKVTLEDEYVYIRLHFDVEIPTYLIDKLEYVENVTATCEIEKEESSTDCDKNNKEDKNEKHDCDKDDKKEKEQNHDCDKDDKKENKKQEHDKDDKKDNNKQEYDKDDKEPLKNNHSNKSEHKTSFIKKCHNKIKSFFKKLCR